MINRPRSAITFVLAGQAALAGCEGVPQDRAAAESITTSNGVIERLNAGEPVFGIFSGEHTPEQGAKIAELIEADFIFYSLESGPFDIPAMQAYLEAMHEAAEAPTVASPPLLLRIPPITDGEATRERVREALNTNVSGIVFPHVTSAEQAEMSVAVMGDRLWPGNPQGDLVNVVIVEDPEGIENVGAIARTAGLTVLFPGPGDLRRAYDGNMDAVELAIQTVLSACKEVNLPCGITAGSDDIEERLEQGFRVFIVSQPEALTVGRAAANRF